MEIKFNSYKSVKNTAKNNKMIRAEIRELVLCYILTLGIYRDRELAEKYYPGEPHRQKQFTYIPKYVYPRTFVGVTHRSWYYLFAKTYLFMKNFFKEGSDALDRPILYDTKKLRIYCDRLLFGRQKTIRLSRTAQYLWTKAFLLYLVAFTRGDITADGFEIDLNKCWFYKNTEDKAETEDILRQYLIKVCNFLEKDFFIKDGQLTFKCGFQKLAEEVSPVALDISLKFTKGRYLAEENVFLSYKGGENACKKDNGADL